MRVRRLRLHYAKKKWETVADIVIERKTLSQSHTVPAGASGGFWYELRDKKGKLLYSRKMSNPFSPSLELFEADGSVSRADIKREEVIVELLFPDMPEATEIRIFSDVTPNGDSQQRASLIRTVPLERGKGYGKDSKGKGHGRR